MDIPIKHQAFANRGLALRPAGLFNGPQLILDGRKVKGRRLRFSVRDNLGTQREIRLKSNYLDPVPKVQIGDQTLELATPLAWYQYVWMSFPIVLVFSGGVLGAMFGVAAVLASGRIFRSDHATAAKYVLSALLSIGAVLGYLTAVVALRLLVGMI
jgi:hypothetical protein